VAVRSKTSSLSQHQDNLNWANCVAKCTTNTKGSY